MILRYVLVALLLTPTWSRDGSNDDPGGAFIRLQKHGVNSERDPPKTNGEKSAKEQWKEEFAKKEALKKLCMSSSLTRFEVKHLYLNGGAIDINGNVRDSFVELTRDPSYAKQYLIDLNYKLYQSGILPYESRGSGEQFDNWFERIKGEKETKTEKSVKVTIIDTDIDTLTADIRDKFNEWKSKQVLTSDGKLSPESIKKLSRRGKDGVFFMTENEYVVTDLTLHYDGGVPVNVEVRAAQVKTKVELGVNENGKPKHFNKMDPRGSKNILHESRVVGTFTQEELEIVAKATRKFWDDLGLTELTKTARRGVLEENYVEFKRLKGIADETIKAVTESATHLNPEIDKELITPKEFIEKYTNAGEAEKRKMAEMVRINEEKIKLKFGSEEDFKNMWKLVEYEALKSHVEVVDTISNLEEFKEPPHVSPDVSESATSEFLHGIEKGLNKVKSKVRLSNTKIYKKISAFAERPGVKGFSKGVTTLASLFLAQNFYNCFKNGDTTSEIIIGSRVGYDLITNGVASGGVKIFGEISKLGKAATILGKVAFPIGAAADIGLSIWSITKSVGRLYDVTNKYDRDDAIADIVSDSLGLVNTIIVTGLSMAFPLAAPFFMAVGILVDLATKFFVNAFKVQNQMEKIDSEVGLLDFEKDEYLSSRFFDWFGTRKPDYIDSMMEERAVNDLAVKGLAKILEENDNLFGIVFPSRTVYYDGECCLTKRWCQLKNAWGCTTWAEDRWTVKCGCDFKKPCTDGRFGSTCDNYWTRIGAWGYDDYECHCSGKPNVTFGYSRKNSHVDFSQKRWVYWERAVPGDVAEAEFKCKPGSLNYVDEKTSQWNTTYSFLCENVIAIIQPSGRRRPEEQQMIYKLEDGHDTVIAGEEPSSNLFMVGEEGTKGFTGATRKDEFIFDSDCSKRLGGYLDGNGGDDSITIEETCARGLEVQVDFKHGNLTSVGNNLDMRFYNVEEFNGREGEPEIVEAACSARKINTRGGTATRPDRVFVPEDSSCGYNLTVVGAAFTDIDVRAGKGHLNLYVNSPWTGLKVGLDIHPREELQQNVIFLKTSANDIKNWSLKNESGQMHLGLQSLNESMEFTFRMTEKQKDVSILFKENPEGAPFSVLFIAESEKGLVTEFYHSLPGGLQGNLSRRGCDMMENVFDVSGDFWNVTAGELGDVFILNTSKVGWLDGGGGVDSIRFNEKFRELAVIDLGGRIRSIENVYGLSGVPIHVTTACNTVLVAGQGGSEVEPDVVTIPKGTCTSRNTQVVAGGNTRVVMEGGSIKMEETDVVQVVARDGGQNDFRFELESRSPDIANLQAAILVTHKNWTVVEAKSEIKSNNYLAILEGFCPNGTSGNIKFNFKQELTSNQSTIQLPYIQLSLQNSNEVPGILIMTEDSTTPKVVFQLNEFDNSTASTVTGYFGIQNIFQLSTSIYPLEVTGGNMSDQIIVTANRKDGGRSLVNGGPGGDNRFILESGQNDSKSAFVINLVKNEFGYSTTPPEKRSKVENVQMVVGREAAPDLITPRCDTKAIHGLGGHGPGKESDVILINLESCQFDLSTGVGLHTNLKNTAPKGQFTYLVEDLMTSNLELTASQYNQHLVKFSFHPWKFIKAVAFNDSTKEFGWKLFDGKDEKVQVFELWKPTNSNEYTNPAFEFHSTGSMILSDLRVNADGVTMSTIHIFEASNADPVYGLPVDVNSFLINITSTSTTPSGSITGCSDGSRCSLNNFWIFNLESSLDTLDGGNCTGDDGCTNVLHFSSTFARKGLHVDLDISNGSIRTNEGADIISNLRNIQQLHGTQDITAYVTSDTTYVSSVDQVIIKPGSFPLDLVIELENYTNVEFQESIDEAPPNVTDSSVRSLVQYHFLSPMSFDPDESYGAMLRHDHIYKLSFNLSSMSDLFFAVDEDRLYYTLNGEQYFYHTMISAAGYTEQFHSQPSIVTQDGFTLQVSKSGSILATLGNTSSEIPSSSVPYLEEIANKLGVTILINTPTKSFFIGNSKSTDDHRNALQNKANVTNYLGGGGADNTIYELLHLDDDVYIYTGYNEDSFDNWTASGNGTKQILDLTDVVVPIRLQTKSKYLPSLKAEGDNLVIRMEGHENMNPGKIVIMNGANSWVAKRLQILLHTVLMDIEAESEASTSWRFLPIPVLIPADNKVFSISPDELEDNQSIRFEEEDHRDSVNSSVGVQFQAVRNGGDLYLTNLKGCEGNGIKTLKINDFYRRSDKMSSADTMIGVTIHMPGLHLMINGSSLLNMTSNDGTVGNISNASPTLIIDWRQGLEEAENSLLKGMPEIPRTFQRESQTDWVTPLIAVGVCLLLGMGGVFIYNWRRSFNQDGLNFGSVWQSVRTEIGSWSFSRRRHYERL